MAAAQPSGEGGVLAALAPGRAQVLALCPKLRVLELGLVGSVDAALADALADPRLRVRALDLQRALVLPQECEALVRMLLPRAEHLRTLILDYNSLADAGCQARLLTGPPACACDGGGGGEGILSWS